MVYIHILYTYIHYISLLQIEGAICSTEELKSHDNALHHINFTLQHTDDQHVDQDLHKWIINMDVESSKKTTWFNIAGNVQRTAAAETHTTMVPRDWKVCVICKFIR